MTDSKKILIFTKYPRIGASSRLRSLQYLPMLEQQGFKFTVRSLFDEAYLNNLYGTGGRSRLAVLSYYFKRLLTLFTVWRYDLVWIEKELFPYFPAVFEKLLAIFCVKYIVDYDDAIFHNYDLSGKKVIRYFLSKKIDKVMKYSSYVMAGNAYLAERAKCAGAKNIQLLPTVVNHLRYQQRENLTEDVLTVGWIGSPSTQKYVVEILPALLAVYQQQPFRLLLVGATDDARKELQGLDVDIYPWSEETEADLIRLMDMGIMPLHDGPWEKGKCGYKIIQYMACGVPVVASDVGVNSDIVKSSKSGLLVCEPADWQSALLKLLTSLSLRTQCGQAGRLAVEKRYSVESQLPILKYILSSLVK